jgi:2-polyprenyl-6-methoxyphenol hydroxylase-like FAD-dependent oxidoreductase
VQQTTVIVIGGGPGGLACGITLASACRKPWFGDRRILVIDDDRSDLNKAQLFNAPGMTPGTSGMEALGGLRRQLLQYPPASLIAATAVQARREDSGFVITLDDDSKIESALLVLATGYKRFEISGLPIAPVPHVRGGKTDRIMLSHDGCYRIMPDLHVAGLLAGGSSQFAIAAGIGAQVAVEILSSWAGKRTHVHDVPVRSTADEGCDR